MTSPFFLRLWKLSCYARHRNLPRWRSEAGFDAPDYPWPSLSLIIPCHNEGAVLKDTLDALCQLPYPGPRPEIIVALNGCTDDSATVAAEADVTVIESATCGMSFGKNLGGQAATGDLLVFVDADTTLTPDALQILAESFHQQPSAVATMAGGPDRGGPMVQMTFLAANLFTRHKQVHAPSGVLACHRHLFETVKGFDETLPQGTSTDFILRTCEAGGTYLFVDRTVATTSIRRFEKTGIVHQMLDWRKNHKLIQAKKRKDLQKRDYDVIR